MNFTTSLQNKVSGALDLRFSALAQDSLRLCAEGNNSDFHRRATVLEVKQKLVEL